MQLRRYHSPLIADPDRGNFPALYHPRHRLLGDMQIPSNVLQRPQTTFIVRVCHVMSIIGFEQEVVNSAPSKITETFR